MTNDALKGCHILITRPKDQADIWALELKAKGALCTVSPVMEIAPLVGERAGSLKSLIENLDHYQWVIFVSQNAVRFGCDRIDAIWPQIPLGVNFIGIGKATEAALVREGLAPYSIDQTLMNSESLLELPCLQSVRGQKILILRGVGGRGVLGDTLVERGAKVDYGELYHRLQVDSFDIPAPFISDHLHKRIVAVHSGESLQFLIKLTPKSMLPWLYQMPILVPGERVAKLAKSFGFKEIVRAINATSDSMIEALYEWQKSR